MNNKSSKISYIDKNNYAHSLMFFKELTDYD